MPTLRDIFKKSKSVTKSSVNNALDSELTDYSYLINWLYTILFAFMTTGSTYLYILRKLIETDKMALPFLGAIIIFFPITIYYFMHARNKTRSKGKILIIVLIVIGNLIDLVQ